MARRRRPGTNGWPKSWFRTASWRLAPPTARSSCPCSTKRDLRSSSFHAGPPWRSRLFTTQLRALEECDLIERREDPSDDRAFRIYLTQKGRAFKTVALQVLDELEAEASKLLPEGMTPLKTPHLDSSKEKDQHLVI
jgi:hypothetical protein